MEKKDYSVNRILKQQKKCDWVNVKCIPLGVEDSEILNVQPTFHVITNLLNILKLQIFVTISNIKRI